MFGARELAVILSAFCVLFIGGAWLKLHYGEAVPDVTAPAPSVSAVSGKLAECTRLLSAASDGRELWVQRARAAEKQLADLSEERASLKPAGAKR